MYMYIHMHVYTCIVYYIYMYMFIHVHAYIFTFATSNGRAAALDIGIASPDAAGAGEDCKESMVRRKTGVYAPYTRELERSNIEYKPLVWSTFGRPHADSKAFIAHLSRRVARRRAFCSAHVMQRRLECSIATEIWRRAARMVKACWPSEVPDAPGD